MIVYVESNFVLEIAREQDELEPASKILILAEEGKIELAFPGFSLSECFSTVMRQRNTRNDLFQSLTDTVGQLRRSKSYHRDIDALSPLLELLKSSIGRDMDSLHSAIERLLSAGRAIETDITSFRQAVHYQKDLDLKPQDSIIFSAIVSDLMRRKLDETKYFLSRDYKAFAENPRIKSELREYGCKYMKSFIDGLAAIEATIRRA